jgi:hypothetical protein
MMHLHCFASDSGKTTSKVWEIIRTSISGNAVGKTCASGFLDLYVEEGFENNIQVVCAWVADMEARAKLAKILAALFCMGVKLGHSQWGRNIAEGCLSIGC